MPGWSKQKRVKFEEQFYSFLSSCFINSKNTGFTCLGDNLYDGQRRFITTVLDGLENDIHKFYVLKSRQLGLSTISRALSIFYIGIHRGLGGALVFDSSENRESARAELEAMIDDLPAKLKFPAVKSTNRQGLTLVNKSRILFKAAGVKKTAQSGGLGRSVGLSMAHMSELCSYSDPEGLESFENSLSDENPDRLYIYESTARGFNLWHQIWTDARKDPTHCSCLFLGWYEHPKQRIEKDHPDFQLYGLTPPTPKEEQKIAEVKKLYDVEITVEQLAWIRRRMNPSAQGEGDADPEFEGSNIKIQEQPWCVTREMRVGTARGLLQIEDIREGDVTTRGLALKAGATGKAVVWKAKTKLGYEIRGTANHPLIDVEGNKIRLDASLHKRVKLQPPRFAAELHTVKWKEGVCDIAVSITPDFARFIGLFMGDGSASAGGGKHGATCEVKIVCCNEDPDIVVECARLFQELFNVTASISAFREGKGWTDVRSGVRMVFDTVKKLGLTRNDIVKTMRRVHVPDFIWRSPKPVVREFLRGLFEADGFNGYETNRVALFSKYPGFIKDVQLLLLGFGITSRAVEANKKAGDGHFYTGRQLELRTAEAIKFNTEIGFLSKRKIGRFDPAAYEKKWATKRRGNSKRPAIVLEDEIVSVESENVVEEVFNLTVEGEHLFDANGILTHNTEEEAFQQTGSIFFSAEKLTEMTNNYVNLNFKSYMYSVGAEFSDTIILKAPTTKMAELKVWEEPDPDGYYVLGCDPAFGENETNDRSSIQVCRCYADGIDQVAEYASPLVKTDQLAYIIASLMGWYGGGQNAQIKYALELNGPGTSVFQCLRSLRHQLESRSYMDGIIQEAGLKDVFRNVRTYVYSRPDSLQGGAALHIRTTAALKITLMEALRNHVSSGKFRIRSMDLVSEMKSIAREGDTIKAPGAMKDDRVLAASFAINCWETGPRRILMAANRTRESEAARQRVTIADQVRLYQQNQLLSFFASKGRARVAAQREQMRRNWRGR